MSSVRTNNRLALHQMGRVELERRAARLRQHIVVARARLHRACEEVTAAERVLLARRLEREEVALRLARLADVLECLERAQDGEEVGAPPD